MRSQDEIVTRITAIADAGGDLFGWARDTLICALDYEHAKPYLLPEATAETWETDETYPTDEKLRDRTNTYLAFAVEKALAHRGISASRSVEKLTQFAWLAGRDDVVTAMTEADHRNYGAPIIRVMQTMMEFPATTDPEFINMAEGKPCTPDCVDGCDQ